MKYFFFNELKNRVNNGKRGDVRNVHSAGHTKN